MIRLIKQLLAAPPFDLSGVIASARRTIGTGIRGLYGRLFAPVDARRQQQRDPPQPVPEPIVPPTPTPAEPPKPVRLTVAGLRLPITGGEVRLTRHYRWPVSGAALRVRGGSVGPWATRTDKDFIRRQRELEDLLLTHGLM